jgi:hypothetical protein
MRLAFVAVASCFVAALSPLLAGCAPVVAGGSLLPLRPELADGARVDVITLSSGWLRSEPDFADTFTEELREELTLCAAGPRRLNLRVHLDELQRGDRAPGATHYLSGVVEFVDPASGAAVGRYLIEAEAGTQNPLAAMVADRQMVVSEAFGRELCRQAFGRSPEGDPRRRATGH